MKRLGSVVLIGVVVGGILSVAAGPALAAPGNNGTVKVDGEIFDDLPNNEPHVGCVFQIDFYGYDEGELFASASFELDPPTGTMIPLLSRTGIFIGEDSAAGGGSTAGLDATELFDLSKAIASTGEPPHPQQGWHVGLTVNADGSIGADVKHKEFWVTDCGGYAPRAPAAPSVRDQQLAANQREGSPSPPSLNIGSLVVIALAVGAVSVFIRRRMRASIER